MKRDWVRYITVAGITLGAVLAAAHARPSGADNVELAICGAPAVDAGISELTLPAFEQRLSLGTEHFLRGTRFWIRRIFRAIARSAEAWSDRLGELLMFAVLSVVAPLLDRSLLSIWRQRGFARSRVSFTLAVAVYLRLIIDRRTPTLGKALVVIAIAYGVAPMDVIPDRVLPFGLLDDVVAVTVAARCFIGLCPDRLINEHVARARRLRSRREAKGAFPDSA